MNKIQNEKWVNALPDEAVSIAEEINIEIAKVIAERIKTIGELSPSDVKKLTNSLEYLGADFGKITKLIAKYSDKGQQAVVDTLKQVADTNDDFAKTFYSAKGIAAQTWRNDQYLHSLVESMARQTAAEFTNLSQTLAYKIDDRYIPLRQMYSRAIDKAIYEVQSGTVDYHTAMRKTVRDLATGLRVKDSTLVVDQKTGEVKLHWDSGYSRRLDSHIRQNLIDGVKQLQSQMLDYHGDQFGADGVELSAHAISAPDHLPVQGRQFSNEEFFKMQNAMDFEDVKGKEYKAFPRPIGQWNCRHVRFPIIIGISEPVHSDEQLKEFAENSKKKYELTQQQRAMETKLRSLKTQRLAASAAGDELEAKRLQRKINEQQTIYRRFSEKHDLLYDTQRASVQGYRRISTKMPMAAHSAERNTGKILKYNPNADFSVNLDSLTPEVNKSISIASRKVAEMGGKTNKEYLSLIDIDTGEEVHYEPGNEESVGSDEFWDCIRRNKSKKLAFIHNHNTDGYFSETDMRTLLTTKNIKIFGAIRIDGVKYFAEKTIDLEKLFYFDPLFEEELKDLNYQVRNGIITAGERTHRREEIIVDGLLKKYTKGLIEIDGRK